MKKAAIIILTILVAFSSSGVCYAIEEAVSQESAPEPTAEAVGQETATAEAAPLPTGESKQPASVISDPEFSQEPADEAGKTEPEEGGLDDETSVPYQQEQSAYNNFKKEAGLSGALRVDNFSGAAVYNLNLQIPQGRQGFQPALNLYYNSHDKSPGSWVGQGWSLDLGYIKRSSRRGTNHLYDSDEYTLFLNNKSYDLISLGSNIYGARVESDYLKIEYVPSTESWLVTDTLGNKYYLGQTQASRQDNQDHSKTYKWLLDKVIDPNDNYYRIEYQKDNNQIYPQSIYYTGYGSTDGPMQIIFNLADRGTDDYFFSYEPQFAATTTKVLENILIKVENQDKAKYEFNYTAGENGNTNLLQSVTKYGYQNGQWQSLPATSFSYQDKPVGWVDDTSSWPTTSLPHFNTNPANNDSPSPLIDINSDSWVDIGGQLNSGNGWNGGSYGLPAIADLYDHSIMGDINGDKCSDFIVSVYGESDVYLNNCISGFGQSTPWTEALPDFMKSIPLYSQSAKVALVDVNGDGLDDLIQAWSASGTQSRGVYINNGNGWSGGYGNFPAYLASCSGNPMYCETSGTQLVDINGDGLVDVFTPAGVYLNTGNGWEQEPAQNWVVPELPYGFGNAWKWGGGRLSDINSDGLVDLAIAAQSYFLQGGVWNIYYYYASYLNTGNGWQQNNNWNLPIPVGYNVTDIGTRLMDINNDGLIDIVESYCNNFNNCGNSTERVVYLGDGLETNLLSAINNGYGGSTQIEYQASGRYFDDEGGFLNPKLPLNLQTVKQITTTDGLGNETVTTYEYQEGAYYTDSDYTLNKFAGFGIVTEQTGDRIIKTYYHQGSAEDHYALGEYDDNIYKKGRMYRQEVYQQEGANLYILSQNINTWKSEDLGDGRTFVYLDSSVTYDYEEDQPANSLDSPGQTPKDNSSDEYVRALNKAQGFVPETEPQLVSQSEDGWSQTYYLGMTPDNKPIYQLQVYSGQASASFLDEQLPPVNSESGDGYVAYNDAVDWSTLVNSAIGNSLNWSDNSIQINNNYIGPMNWQYQLGRVFLPFNTSDLPDESLTVTQTQLRLTVNPPVNDRLGLIVVSSNQTNINSLQASDYGTVGNVEYGSFWMSDPGTYTQNLNSAGRAWVNQTGWTKYALRGDFDFDNQAPTDANYNIVRMSEWSNVDQRPLLTITYVLNNSSPTAPTELQTEQQVDPIEVTDQNPEFSAIYNDDNPGDLAVAYNIQVYETNFINGTTTLNLVWDSDWTDLTIQIAVGQRSEEIEYNGPGPLPLDGRQYFWKIRFKDNGGPLTNQGLWSDYANFYMDGSLAPTPPIGLETEDKTNPLDIINLTPSFTAVYTDGNPIDYAKWYQIQVDNNSDFSSLEWDSQKTLLNQLIDNGFRSEDIIYNGQILEYDGTTYYWRIKFWDDEGENGTEGAWSGSATFVMFDEADMLANAEAKAVKYQYDAYGNINSEINYGQVNAANNGVYLDIGSDRKNSSYQYAENSEKYIHSAPKNKILTDQSGSNSTATDLYYDDLPLGQVDYVNLTKEDMDIAGIDYEAGYNSYGLVVTSTDPLGNNTTITYDSNNYYPYQTTNALNQTVTTIYDLTTGQVLETTDPNGLVEQRSYDAFGRLLEVKRSDPANPADLISMETYEYHTDSTPFWARKSTRVDENNWVDVYTYFDGLGRVIQTKKATPNPDGVMVEPRVDYNFEEGAGTIINDATPYENDGTLLYQYQNNAEWVAGYQSEYAIYLGGDPFNGSYVDYISIPNNQSLTDFNNTISIEADFKTNVLNSYMSIIAKAGFDCMVHITPGGLVNFILKFTDGSHLALNSNTAIQQDVWYNVKATYDGERMRLYLDNQLVGELEYQNTMIESTSDFYIGWSPSPVGAAYIFKGTIDNVKVSQGDVVYGYNKDYITVSYQYDEQGNLIKQSLPYLEDMEIYSEPTWNLSDQPYNSYDYDARGRVMADEFQSSTNNWTTSYQYNSWKTSITDPNGNIKHYYSNAHGKLAQVEEVLNGQPYSTVYSYNYQDNLINITDSLTNQRNFEYDSLGRLTSQEEMHTPSAQSWGAWTQEYDEASNLISKTDAKNQTVAYTYDELNRILTEDSDTTPGITDVSYVYDQGNYGIGRLSSAAKNTGPAVSTEYTYDIWGRVTAETKNIKYRTFTTGYTYNLSSQPLTITYPDDFVVRYSYNTVGQTNQVFTQEPGSSESGVVSSVSYSPLGQISEINYTNGTISQMTYDIGESYRLMGKETNIATSTLQDISYTYDNVGNITDIADTAPNQLAKTSHFEYDDLYRLSSANIIDNYSGTTTVQTFSYDIIGNILNKSDIGDYSY
ncbi:hypothetical protein KJ840_05355, partial [Patescibacteria group bacterium]|nr:hypothetical protein [Patescibacteria group bacterium]